MGNNHTNRLRLSTSDFSINVLTGSLGLLLSRKQMIFLVQTPYIAAMGEGGEPWVNGASMNNQGLEFDS